MISRGQVTSLHEISANGVDWQPAEKMNQFFSTDRNAQEEIIEAEVVEPEPKPSTGSPGGDNIPNTNTWYAHIGGENKGPVSEQQLLLWKRSGRLTKETLVWKDGMSDWTPAEIAFPSYFIDYRSSGGQQTTWSQNQSSQTNGRGTGNRTSGSDLPSGMSITSMILGIISVVTCTGFLTGVPAIIFSAVALSRCNKGTGGGKGMAITGLTTGIISSIVSLTYVLWIAFSVGLGSLYTIFGTSF